MTPTERLRELLDERGVEWKSPASYDGSTKYDTIVGDYWFNEYDGKITVHGLTPEQAIAATVGSGRAEDVIRQLIARLSVAADFHFATKYVDCIVEEYSGKLATLGRGTCRNVHEPPKDTTFWPCPHFKCSECGEVYVSMQYVFFCPHCGRRVQDV